MLAAPLSLAEARAIADRRNGGLLASQAAVAVARAAVEAAGQLPNPTASASYGADDPKLQTGLDVKLPVFGQRGAAIDSAQALEQVAEAETEAERARLHAAVRRAFAASWAAGEQAQLAAEAARIAGELAKLTAERFRTGGAPQIDVEQASLAGKRAQQDRQDREAEAAASRRELEAILAQPVDAVQAPAATEAPPESELLQRAARHPEVEVLRRQQQASLARADEERAAIRPLPTVGVTALRFVEPPVYWGLRGTVSFDLPLLSWNRGRIHEQEESAQHAATQAQAALQRLAGQVRAARARWAAASARASFYAGAFVESARRVLEMAESGYRIGRTSLIAVLQAQNELSSARSRAIDAALEAQRALADLEEATGADL